jgi:hypothetical protein
MTNIWRKVTDFFNIVEKQKFHNVIVQRHADQNNNSDFELSVFKLKKRREEIAIYN